MQQRYYDPLIGQHFLSVDPVTAYSPGGAFNQYWYANADPYGFFDPDGRQAESSEACDLACKRRREEERHRHNDQPYAPSIPSTQDTANRIAAEINAKHKISSKGEADFLYESNQDENLAVEIDADGLTVLRTTDWEVRKNSRGGTYIGADGRVTLPQWAIYGGGHPTASARWKCRDI